MTGSRRTPIYQAVSRLATDILVNIHHRYGMCIAPIDLVRERTLLQLRKDLERLVLRLAVERATATHRTQIMHVARTMRSHLEERTTATFNVSDSRVEKLILDAGAEPFLEHTLRPLHAIFPGIGCIHHVHIGAAPSGVRCIDAYLVILDAVATRHIDKAVAGPSHGRSLSPLVEEKRTACAGSNDRYAASPTASSV